MHKGVQQQRYFLSEQFDDLALVFSSIDAENGHLYASFCVSDGERGVYLVSGYDLATCRDGLAKVAKLQAALTIFSDKLQQQIGKLSAPDGTLKENKDESPILD